MAKSNTVAEGPRTTIYITEKYAQAYEWVQKHKAVTGTSTSNIILDILLDHVENMEHKQKHVVLPIKSYKDGKMSYRKVEFQGKKITTTDNFCLPRSIDSVPGYNGKLYSNMFMECNITVYQMLENKLLAYIKKQAKYYDSFDPEYGIGSEDDGVISFEIAECKIYQTLEDLADEYPEIPQKNIDEIIIEFCPSENI